MIKPSELPVPATRDDQGAAQPDRRCAVSRPRLRPHRWVTLTREYVDSLLPCGNSAEARALFLPARISTDPERNIPLALEIWSRGDVSRLVHWLVWNVGAKRERNCFSTYTREHGPLFDELCPKTGDSGEELPQWLAWIADWADVTACGTRPELWATRNEVSP